jgi:transposase-like protein
MHTVSYSRHRFPAGVIQHAVWLYFRFPLSFRDVEDLLARRGIDVSYETVRRWSVRFGLAYAETLRKTQSHADVRWHLDESLSGLTASAFIFGAQLIAKAKSWTCCYNLARTSRPR